MVTPTAPMPVQTAYAVATAATTQTTLHHNRVNPSDCLMARAPTISSRPATVPHRLSIQARDGAPRADMDTTVDLAMLAWDGAVGQADAKPLGTP